MRQFFFRRLAVRFLPLLTAFVLASCVSTEQIKQIVSESNAATLSAELNPGSASAAGTANVQEISKKIEAFIAANPDQKTTNASLRVRQALTLLQNGQPNLAAAAFDQANVAD